MIKNIIKYKYDIFNQYFEISDMASDPVVNVRIVLSKLLKSLFKIKRSLFYIKTKL